MSSYALLWKGDRLPTVGVLQSLINRAGATLKIDGIFGEKTHTALVEFQRQRQMSPDGIADKATWERLMYQDNLPLIDIIDIFDQNLYENQAAYIVKETGGTPVFLGGMSNGLAQLAVELSTARVAFLLRIIGHGCPGVQAISMGKGGWISYRHGHKVYNMFPHETSSLNNKNMKHLPIGALQATFGPYASVELHGCHVAAGATGHRFIKTLANMLRVPVTAGTKSQRSAIRFDGPTVTALPHRTSLAEWCAKLPEFMPVTVP